jgi:hypothetical protein
MRKIILAIGIMFLILACNVNIPALSQVLRSSTATPPLAVVVPTFAAPTIGPSSQDPSQLQPFVPGLTVVITPTTAATQVIAPTVSAPTQRSSQSPSPAPTQAATIAPPRSPAPPAPIQPPALAPTQPPVSPTQVPTQSAADGAVYDNFNDAKFNGTINPDLWLFPGSSPTCSDTLAGQFFVRQENGALAIDIRCGGLPYGLEIRNGKRPIEKMRFFESRIKLTKGSSDVSGKFSMQVAGDMAGSNWSTSCQIQLPSGAAPLMICNNMPGVTLNYDTYYKVRIEINPNMVEVSYFLDDKPLGKYVPENYRMIGSFTPGFSAMNLGGGALGTIYIDDVRVSP